jgi:TonB-dependent receptor
MSNVFSTSKFNGSYLKILPSASLRYALTHNTNLRFVYGRGLSRPDPQDIAQAVTFTTTGSPGSLKNSVTLGNPNLKAETADNFDVLIEQYLNPFGMISAGYFYKNLSDAIVTNSFVLTNFQPSPTAPVGTYTATQPVNAGSAWISGFEAAYLQHLSFLPGKLGGLGISANYGYTASRAEGLSGRADHPRLLRNAPNTWNISPTYDRGRFSIRVGLSHNQANINSYNFQDGTGGSTPDPWRSQRPVRRHLLLLSPSSRGTRQRPPQGWAELRCVWLKSHKRSFRLLSGPAAIYDSTRILHADGRSRIPLVAFAREITSSENRRDETSSGFVTGTLFSRPQ